MAEHGNKPYLSLVIPLFNEEEVLPLLIKELKIHCDALGKSYEIVFVNDGSTDDTANLLREYAGKDPKIKVIQFSRNFGHQAAFSAGIDFAQGDMVITMDGDLQHPPRLIKDFIKEAEAGYDIVIGERIYNKQNSVGREFLGKIIYKFLSKITSLEFRNVSDFALYKRSVISVFKRLPERERFLRGIVQWVGFKKKYTPYIVDERKAGVPKYTFKKLSSLVLSGLTSFSAFPLRLSFWVGMAVFIGSIIFSGYVVFDHYLHPNPLIPGWATVVILVSMLSSFQLIILGIVGEYLYKMFNEIKGRPLYIVAETYNIDKEGIEYAPYGIHAN